MKKTLLSIAMVLLAGNVFAQEDLDLTPAKYKYAQLPVGPVQISGAYNGGNLPAPSNKIWEAYDNGLFVVRGGQFDSKQPYFKDLQAGTSIVDLGGEVGKVLCINGVNSEFNKRNELTYPQCTGGLNWFGFHWFMDPQNTPQGGTEEAPNIRVRMVMNVYSNTPDESANIMDKAYTVNNQGNVCPNESYMDENLAVRSGEFVATYEDGTPEEDENGDYIYDASKWMVYEWDTYCPYAESEDAVKATAPLHIKTEFNAGNLAGATVFIKEVTFTKLADTSKPIIDTRNKSFLKLTVDPQAYVTAITTPEMDAANVKTVYYDMTGKQVAKPSAKGVYIAKQGNKAFKFFVR